jgi:hypothetical protein
MNSFIRKISYKVFLNLPVFIGLILTFFSQQANSSSFDKGNILGEFAKLEKFSSPFAGSLQGEMAFRPTDFDRSDILGSNQAASNVMKFIDSVQQKDEDLLEVSSLSIKKTSPDKVEETLVTAEVIRVGTYNEVILKRDLPQLDNTGEYKFIDMNGKKALVYSCDEVKFEKIFPRCLASEMNSSVFAGLITEGGELRESLGTGTLLEIEEENGSLRGRGLTVLHNFISCSSQGKVDWQSCYNYRFILGCKDAGNNRVTNYGEMIIDKILIEEKPLKDICVFEGTIAPNLYAFDENVTEYIHFLKNDLQIPQLVEEEVTFKEGEELEGVRIYHYPLGRKEQRKNEGSLVSKDRHTITSVPASSGAAILREDGKIVGIHTGAFYDDFTDEVVKIEEQDYIPIANFNRYVLISKADYDRLLKGVNIYGAFPYTFKETLKNWFAKNKLGGVK